MRTPFNWTRCKCTRFNWIQNFAHGLIGHRSVAHRSFAYHSIVHSKMRTVCLYIVQLHIVCLYTRTFDNDFGFFICYTKRASPPVLSAQSEINIITWSILIWLIRNIVNINVVKQDAPVYKRTMRN